MVSAKKGQTELTPDHVSHTIPDNRAGCSCEYNDDDVDLTSGGGKECRGNKDCLPWERHAGTLQRDNTKDGPRAVDWDQLNQSIGQRNKLHMLTVFHSASPDEDVRKRVINRYPATEGSAAGSYLVCVCVCGGSAILCHWSNG